LPPFRGRRPHARDRLLPGRDRDAIAAARDDAARRRDARAQEIGSSIAASDAPLAEKLVRIRKNGISPLPINRVIVG